MKSKSLFFILCISFVLGFCLHFAVPLFFPDKRLPEQKIIERIAHGGMGNLMFEYAGAYAYAREHDKKLYVYGSMVELEKAFGMKIDYTQKETPAYSNLTPLQRKEAKIAPIIFDYYNDSFENNDSYASFLGCQQDERFFKKYEKEIRRLFTFKKDVSPDNKNLLKEIKKTNSVSMHIRRGDYLEDKKYFVCPASYYEKAANYIATRVKNPHFYIFSNDMEWARDNIRLPYPHTFVDINQGTDSYNDMHLMSACKHNIIANSSFSWWGAWLNNNPNKIVIAPNVWMKGNGVWGKNILPKEWIQIQAAPKVAVLYIALGKYIVFWDEFYKKMEKNFLPDAAVTYFVWTDVAKKYFPKNVVRIKQKNLGWPDNTLMRFQMFETQKEYLKDFDYVYFLNANMLPVDKIGPEIFPSKEQGLVVMEHPMFYKKAILKFPYDRNPKTGAYIPYGEGERYVMGALNGGTGPAFVRLIEELNKKSIEDKKKGVMPIWHDESYLNKYILNKDPLVLSPAYGYPELNAIKWNPAMREFEGKAKMIILDKIKYGGKKYLRGLEEQ